MDSNYRQIFEALCHSENKKLLHQWFKAKKEHICSSQCEDQKDLLSISVLRRLLPAVITKFRNAVANSLSNLQAPFPLFTPMQYPNLICILRHRRENERLYQIGQISFFTRNSMWVSCSARNSKSFMALENILLFCADSPAV